MDKMLLDYVNNNKIETGAIFNVAGKSYMFVTGMILECLTTGALYMKGIDF